MRPSARAGYDNVRELVGGKLLAFFDQIESKFSEIEEAKATMESVTDGLAKCFTWVKTLNGTFKSCYSLRPSETKKCTIHGLKLKCLKCLMERTEGTLMDCMFGEALRRMSV